VDGVSLPKHHEDSPMTEYDNGHPDHAQQIDEAVPFAEQSSRGHPTMLPR